MKSLKKVGVLLVCALILVFANSCTVVKSYYPGNYFSQADSYYYLPETVLDVEFKLHLFKIDSGDWQLKNQMISISPRIVASNSLFLLNHEMNVFSDDKLVLKSNEQGLLESVTVDVKDNTGQIITDIAKTVISAFGGGVAPIPGAGPDKLRTEENQDKYEDTISIQIQRQVRLSEFNTKVAKLSISEKIPFYFKDSLYSWNSNLSIALEGYKFFIDDETIKGPIKGVLTRPMTTAKIRVTTDSDSMLMVNRELVVNVIDESKLILIPISRVAFVHKKQSLTFRQGVLVSNDLDVPSLMEGIISVPIEIAKAIIALPAELVQLKFNFSGGKDRIDQLEQNMKLLQEQQSELLKKLDEKE